MQRIRATTIEDGYIVKQMGHVLMNKPTRQDHFDLQKALVFAEEAHSITSGFVDRGTMRYSSTGNADALLENAIRELKKLAKAWLKESDQE